MSLAIHAQALFTKGQEIYLQARARPDAPHAYLDGQFFGYRNDIARVLREDSALNIVPASRLYPDPKAAIDKVHATCLEEWTRWAEMPANQIAGAAMNMSIQRGIREAEAANSPAHRQAGARGLLERLTSRGIELEARGGKHLSARPAAKLTENERVHLGVYKAELIEEVGRDTYLVP